MEEILPTDTIIDDGGEQYVIRDGKRYQVKWQAKPELKPVLELVR